MEQIKKNLKLGIPSKGRLKENTKSWLLKNGISLVSEKREREYSAMLEGVQGISPVLLSASDIPREMKAGRIHLGITGQDLVQETIPFWNKSVIELSHLGFGHADLVLAVPKFWIDVETLNDFDIVASLFRRDYGFRLRIATKYHNLLWSYLSKNGVADYQIVDSQGATEGAVKNLFAEAIADISSSGETLKANNLKTLDEMPILKSQATLFVSSSASWFDEEKFTLCNFCRQVGIDYQLVSHI